MTVLIIDDDADLRVLLEHSLKADGIRAIGLARGEWVLLAIDTHHPDVVVLDIQLPGVNGLQVLDQVRHRWPELPVIVMTSFAGPDTREDARRRGATEFLDKPFSIAHLVSDLVRATRGPGAEPDRGYQSGRD
jgi:two-component system nitrogen regulation response regulator GlnG